MDCCSPSESKVPTPSEPTLTEMLPQRQPRFCPGCSISHEEKGRLLRPARGRFSTSPAPMDVPWQGHVAWVAEHFVALGRLQVIYLLERLPLMADGHGNMTLQQATMAVLVLGGGALLWLSLRAAWIFTEALAFLLASAVILVLQLLQMALPYLLVLALVLYLSRLLHSPSLQKEWLDFLWSRQLTAASVDCPICAESLEDNAWQMASLPCCARKLCWSCLRRHAESVIDDARPEMNCPLLCKAPVPDVMVLCAFRRHQWSWQGLDLLGGRGRRKLRAYERWSLTSGLAASCAARMEDVVHCPGSDCSHMWLLPRDLRRAKASQEPGSRWDPRSWPLARHMGFYTAPLVGARGQDSRCVHCPRCQLEYCLLCSQLWEQLGSCHKGKSCLEFDAALPQTQRCKERRWAGAKPCPGCGVRTLRSMGCNHMTCTQCAMHWCWVCARPWQPWHYGCTQTQPTGDCALM
ncbi:unnamed protein product [Effrenium voratum]|uniref:RING-type domain-containing protein n=1 Tax=Effrenium voratum TaxID=2562239 RepID=A0AA36I0Z5_9DINO|nr:unnamed protein product [Effrenium voratum]CAJ1378129.1 unnamed protein product [Effrenium voratum]